MVYARGSDPVLSLAVAQAPVADVDQNGVFQIQTPGARVQVITVINIHLSSTHIPFR